MMKIYKMKNHRQILCPIEKAVIFAFFFSLQSLSAQNVDEWAMSLGIDSIHSRGDLCLVLGARAAAGDFFEDLRVHKTHNRNTFRKRGKLVQTFPKILNITVDADLDRCGAKGTLQCDRCEFQFDNQFMNSFRFEVYWKRGLELRQTNIANFRMEATDPVWKYEFNVNSENVPLDDSLVIVLLAPDGRIVSRLSGKATDQFLH